MPTVLWNKLIINFWTTYSLFIIDYFLWKGRILSNLGLKRSELWVQNLSPHYQQRSLFVHGFAYRESISYTLSYILLIDGSRATDKRMSIDPSETNCHRRDHLWSIFYRLMTLHQYYYLFFTKLKFIRKHVSALRSLQSLSTHNFVFQLASSC